MGYAFTIEPITYSAFEDETAQIDKCKEWGLLSEKAAKMKPFYYKRGSLQLTCSIVGYADQMTAVIELENGQKHCIHPSYLKEMQAASYGQRVGTAAEESAVPETAEADAGMEAAAATTGGSGGVMEAAPETGDSDASEEAAPSVTQAKAAANADDASADQHTAAPAAEQPAVDKPAAEQPPKEKAKKGKAAKIELPEEKVKMTATVQQFTSVPNHFTETDDEVIVYEAVAIAEPALELGAAWSSYSNTLKKLELTVGDTITFEAKVVAKKLTKHPVPYKINNPAKIQKAEA
ncbi:hypothetical protein PAESOLCIP111_05848 [Paenibacillus solanacearum]|uniref:Uncharacterized protein n=1 Tax=Paenibacillus solanacearum TaxID=2048548 RepID=A0A916NLC2_9BACL|nr:hypothetical protein [Paenibacillus solanacearum]CAG7649355.1 hypothetical protein PAESOLCIP111_05848 [Paenibacillus solanacearum]